MSYTILLTLHQTVGPRRGVPNQLMQEHNQVMPIDDQLLPTPEDAVALMESLGSSLTLFSPFGSDSLAEREDLINLREATFFGRYPDFGPFFYSVVNGDYSLFREALLYLLDINRQLEQHL